MVMVQCFHDSVWFRFGVFMTMWFWFGVFMTMWFWFGVFMTLYGSGAAFLCVHMDQVGAFKSPYNLGSVF